MIKTAGFQVEGGTMSNLESMKRMFEPRSIAVIGASQEPGKVGYSVVKNIVDGGYKGKIYPINPRAPDVLGYKCYRSVKEIPDVVDVAVFCIPAAIVPNVMAECGEKGVGVAVIITSGFADVGNLDLQKQVVEVAKKYGTRIVGPNIFGYYYTPSDLCATFCIPYTLKGKIALTCQSGGVGMAIIGFTRSKKVGVSAIIGFGNKADVDEDDVLEFFAQDPNTKVIAMHMEDVKDGRKLLEAASRITRIKPVVAMKTGRTARGAMAAASHTGAIAGADAVYDAAFKQAGIIRARALEELLDWARALEMLPPPKGENALILTGAGGLGVILTDACVDQGLQLMTMPPDLEEKFKKYVPPFGAFKNPVDITGSSPPEAYLETVRIALRDPRVDAVIFGYWHTIITTPMQFANAVVQAVEEAKKEGIQKPMVAALAGDVEVEEAARFLEERGIPSYPYAPEKAVSALAAAYRWARYAGLLMK